jgi:peptidyl-prolyl cis-trans isomerase D
MLQNIRDKAQGWIAWAIVILISIPFALWGIQSYLGGGAEQVVAKVNGDEISERALDQRFHRFREQLRARLGEAYRPEMFDDKRMRHEVLKQMVSEDVVLQTSHDMGLRVGEQLIGQAIMQIDAFQKDGRFDQARFDQYARMQGMSSAGFEQRIRQSILTEQLSQAVQTSAFVTDREMQEALRLQNQTRDLAYFIVNPDDFPSTETISEADIKAYYDQHQEEFRVPEKVKLEYVLLNAELAGKTVKVDDAALRGFYENHQENYGQPEERKASHILIRVDADADQAAVEAAKKKITALRERIEQGEDFAEVAKEYSEDPGSAEAGGDLGYFGKGIMDPAFEKTAFSLKEGEVSQPVRSSFGFHLIKVTGIKPSSVKSFEEARSDVERDYRKAEGEKLYFEMAEKLADLSYEDPGSLTPAASALNLKIETSDWISRDQATGILASPKVLAAAFSDDVLQERNNSELIELDKDQSIVLRVVDFKQSSIQPLSQVSEAITEILKKQHATEQARAEAEKRLASLKEGKDIVEVADQYNVKHFVSLARKNMTVPPSLLTEVFQLPHPSEGKPISGMIQLAGGGFAVYNLNKVKEADPASIKAAVKERVKSNLRQRLGQMQYDNLVTDLESRADITYYKAEDREEQPQ